MPRISEGVLGRVDKEKERDASDGSRGDKTDSKNGITKDDLDCIDRARRRSLRKHPHQWCQVLFSTRASTSIQSQLPWQWTGSLETYGLEVVDHNEA